MFAVYGSKTMTFGPRSPPPGRARGPPGESAAAVPAPASEASTGAAAAAARRLRRRTPEGSGAPDGVGEGVGEDGMRAALLVRKVNEVGVGERSLGVHASSART